MGMTTLKRRNSRGSPSPSDVVPVEIAFNIFNLNSIDIISSHFHLDFLLTASWPNPETDYQTPTEEPIEETEGLWNPQIWIRNGMDLEEFPLKNSFFSKNGMIIWKMRYKGTCSSGTLIIYFVFCFFYSFCSFFCSCSRLCFLAERNTLFFFHLFYLTSDRGYEFKKIPF